MREPGVHVILHVPVPEIVVGVVDVVWGITARVSFCVHFCVLCGFSREGDFISENGPLI